MKTEEIKDFANKLGAMKARAAAVRDELRGLIAGAEEIATSFDSADESMQEAINSLRTAADEMSQYV